MRSRAITIHAVPLVVFFLCACGAPGSGRSDPAPTGPLSFDVVLQVGVRFTTGETRDVVQLRRVEQGQVLWATDTWIGYPRKTYHPYRTALVGDTVLLHVPNSAEHRFFRVDARGGGKAVEVTSDDPLVKQAESGNLWSAERDMQVRPEQPRTIQTGD